ncbi:CapA family protein [Fimbriimonas ginsengisoli]|uniref:CapA family protein n=1 Tax=Fimbriimonas ginsengisoli TaxID=1005039 RepID=UPI00046D46C1|nr:CapA family protein [Fimbriimonas ginsengisoli]
MTPILAALLLGSPTADLAAVGDLMLGRYVGRRISAEGVDRIFADSGDELRKADIAFGNLECVLSRRPFALSKQVLLRADPSNASGLSRAGFDILSVANNHSLDAGKAGLDDTVSALTRVGIHPVGSDPRPLVLRKNGLRIAFLAYCDFPGASGISYLDELRLKSDIALARATADVVVISCHWGIELTSRVTERQIHIATLAATSGADVILGHHPHVLQKIAWLPAPHHRRCLVAYSLGNFVFDARTPAEKQTGILHITLTLGGATAYKFSPYQIANGPPLRWQERLTPRRQPDEGVRAPTTVLNFIFRPRSTGASVEETEAPITARSRRFGSRPRRQTVFGYCRCPNRGWKDPPPNTVCVQNPQSR